MCMAILEFGCCLRVDYSIRIDCSIDDLFVDWLWSTPCLKIWGTDTRMDEHGSCLKNSESL